MSQHRGILETGYHGKYIEQAWGIKGVYIINVLILKQSIAANN